LSELLTAGAEIGIEEIKKAIDGLDIDEKRQRLVTYYRRLPAETLPASLGYSEADGAEMYEAAALEYPEAFLSRVRDDLDDGFASFHRQWIETLRLSAPSEEAAKAMEAMWTTDLQNFIRDEYIAASLRVLAVRGDSSDIRFGRSYLTSTANKVKSAAVDVVARFGTSMDAPSLVLVARNSFGAVPAAAAEAATKLSGGLKRVLLPLLTSGNATLIRPAIDRLRRSSKPSVVKILSELLRNEKSSTRLLAAASLSEIDRNLAERIFDDYLKGYRFYDVVCWLDRFLYAPSWLQAGFRRELQETES